MSDLVTQIKAPIIDELNNFSSHFKNEIKSDVKLLDKISRIIIQRKGHEMRSVFLFLSAKLCGKPSKSTYTAASMLELLHTATLVHDDVEDGEMTRNGFWSIGPLWKGKIAVLLGDYLLSQGLLVAIRNKEYRLLEVMSGAIEEISDGELLRIDKGKSGDINEAEYLEIMKKKTASLTSAICQSGAISVGADEEVQKKMSELGKRIGLAFQLREELFTFGIKNKDRKKGFSRKLNIMTLPLVHALDKASDSAKASIIQLINNQDNNPAELEQIKRFVEEANGIIYAKQKIKALKEEAFQLLNTFTNSPERNSFEVLLQDLTDYDF